MSSKTFYIKVLGIMTQNVIMFSIKTISIKTLSIIALSAKTVEWLFTETPFHRIGFSPNILFTEKAAIHLWDCSPNVL
jgi:hypothetical protein